MKKSLTILLSMILAFGLIACETLPDTAELTHKDKAAWAQQLYVGAVKDFKRDAARTDLNDEAKKYLAQKRAVLVRAHPIIKLYKEYADTGQVPSIELQQEMLDIIDELLLYPALEATMTE